MANDLVPSEDLGHLARRAPSMLRPIVKPDELIEAQKETSQLIVRALEQDKDYGVLPGTGKKPTLLKPGAERLQLAFGCHTLFETIDKEIDHDREVKWTKEKKVWKNAFKGDRSFHTESVEGTSRGLYRYIVRATVVGPHGQTVGSGLGSCSTLESKYIDRPRDLENTVLKMAQKRAKVSATLDAFALSDRFTQDMDDVAEEKPEEPRQEQQTREAPRQVSADKGRGQRYDPQNPAHAKQMILDLDAKGIKDTETQEIASQAMKGKYADEMDGVLAELKLPF